MIEQENKNNQANDEEIVQNMQDINDNLQAELS